MVKKPAALQKVQFLKVMKTLNNHQRSVIIEFLDDYGVDIICDCIYNTIYQDHGLKKSSKKRLRKILKGKEAKVKVLTVTKQVRNDVPFSYVDLWCQCAYAAINFNFLYLLDS